MDANVSILYFFALLNDERGILGLSGSEAFFKTGYEITDIILFNC